MQISQALRSRFGNLDSIWVKEVKHLNRRVLMPVTTGVIFALISVTLLGPVCWAARLVVSSRWTSTPPRIDGRFQMGEYSGPQISMTAPPWEMDAYAYFNNDDLNLYVLVDVVGDTTDDPGDLSYLVFSYSNPKSVTAAGTDGSTWMNDYQAVVGFAASPNSAVKHKIYEFMILLSYLNLRPGQQVDLCSPRHGKPSIAYDSLTGRDNVWPLDLDFGNREKWGILTLATRGAYVGGVALPTNPFFALIPYVALFGLAATLPVAHVAKKHRQ